MILDLDNEIDKQLARFYTKREIKNIVPEKINYLGMNIDIYSKNDIQYKLYYSPVISNKKRSELCENNPVTKFLYANDMVELFEVVNVSNDFSRYNIRLKNTTKENIKKLFENLEKNLKFFGKYKDEICKLSQINENSKITNYNPPFFIGFVENENKIKNLKFYWEDIKGDDSISFIKDFNISGLNDLFPIAEAIFKNCGRHLWMIGIDYNGKTSEKHKIYITTNKDPYDGFIKTFPNNDEFEDKINLIRKWNEIHKEFYLDGFAIGKSKNGKLVLNMYFLFE